MPAAGSVILGRVPPTDVSTRAEELAAEILQTGPAQALPGAAIQALCGMACSPDPHEAGAGTEAIFQSIVEHWGDRFEPGLCVRYGEFFSALIECYRRRPGAEAFDGLLRRLGAPDQRALLERMERQRPARASSVPNRAAVRKVLVLSRVTLGADVAVTSVFLAAAKRLFPSAEILLVGGEKAGALFGGDERVRTLRIEYGRSGSLAGRLNAWRETVQAIEQAAGGLKAEEYAILDPDSRITQLGLLPLIPRDASSYFFESRSYGVDTSLPLGQLSGRWLQEAFGAEADELPPLVGLPDEDLELGRLLRRTVSGPIAAVNFGVGGNDAKRVGGRFELNLLRLLFRRGYAVVLDHGAGADEMARTRRMVELCRKEGISAGEIRAGRCDDAMLLTWQGSLNGFAGIIASSDLYAGYDSAGGHLAAALGVAGIDIFSGAVCERMRQRWRPWGKRPGSVAAVEDSAHPDEVLAAAEKLIP